MLEMDGYNLHGLEPSNDLNKQNGSITPNSVGSMHPRRVRMASDCGWNRKTGYGQRKRYGLTCGPTRHPTGFTFTQVNKQSFTTSQRVPVVRPDFCCGNSRKKHKCVLTRSNPSNSYCFVSKSNHHTILGLDNTRIKCRVKCTRFNILKVIFSDILRKEWVSPISNLSWAPLPWFFAFSFFLLGFNLNGNSAPTDINASNLTIAENSAIGTVIGEFNATDLDGDTNITFSIRSVGFSVPSQVWTTSRLTGDGDSGISSDFNYTCAVNVKGTDITINGVTFIGSSATGGAGWIITDGFNSGHSGTTSNILGSVGQMLSTGFRYDGNPQKLKMTGLAVGRNYVFSLYSSAWNTNGGRISDINCTALDSIFTIDQDKYGILSPDGHLVQCFYTANSDEVEFSFSRDGAGSTWHLYAFSNREGVPLKLDTNGTLLANQTFDYEMDDRNYTITVRATDDHNASFDKNFTITVTNVVEDLDGDGTEDHYDLDIDGDGLSNADELLYNSDPWDASSSNRPPSDINASNLTIAENSAIGTVIGEFNATDPDVEGNFSFSLPSANAFYSIETNGTLKVSALIDYETYDSNFSFIVRVLDDHNASFDKNFTIT